MQSENPMSFFSENVDDWGAAEWFDRAAKAIRSQDKANVKGDDIAFETYRMIAASSLAKLVREHEDTVRAALSTYAEPVAWRGIGSDGVSEVTEREDIAVKWREDGIEVTPLYAEPVKTAPAVAVKALKAWGAWEAKLILEGSDDLWDELGDLTDLQALRNAALSAQVQDVAGWQPIETAPMGEAGKPETYFIGARQDGRRVNVHTCFRDQHGAYEFWGGGMTPTHWIAFPATFPASKHGDVE